MKKSFQAIIIDDEESAIEVLSSVVEIFCPNIKIIGTATDILTGAKLLEKVKPDILFLDIEMPSGSGFDLLNSSPQNDYKVIFTTAYSQYAIKAIKRGVHDFLMKPIDPDELKESIDRLSNSSSNEDHSKGESLAIQCLDKIHILYTIDIIRCQSDSNYTHIFLHNGDKLTVSLTLKSIENKLDSNIFIRIHQSHLINKASVKEVIKGKNPSLILTNGEEIPVAQRKKILLKSFS